MRRSRPTPAASGTTIRSSKKSSMHDQISPRAGPRPHRRSGPLHRVHHHQPTNEQEQFVVPAGIQEDPGCRSGLTPLHAQPRSAPSRGDQNPRPTGSRPAPSITQQSRSILSFGPSKMLSVRMAGRRPPSFDEVGRGRVQRPSCAVGIIPEDRYRPPSEKDVARKNDNPFQPRSPPVPGLPMDPKEPRRSALRRPDRVPLPVVSAT